MSHVDEGRLHAFLDGALSAADPADAERVELHLASCADCRARLDEAARLRDQAASLLGAAQPRAFEMPSFDAIRERAQTIAAAQDGTGTQPAGTHGPATSPVRPSRRRGRAVFASPFNGVAWAATLVLAVGLGWLLRDATQETVERRMTDLGRVVQAQRPAAADAEPGSTGAPVGAEEPGSAQPPAAGAAALANVPAAESPEEIVVVPAPSSAPPRRAERAAETPSPAAGQAEYGVALGQAAGEDRAVRVEEYAVEESALAARDADAPEAVRQQAAPERRVAPPAAPPPSPAADAMAGALPAEPLGEGWRTRSTAEAERLAGGELVVLQGARVMTAATRGAGPDLEVRTVQRTARGETLEVVQRAAPVLEGRPVPRDQASGRASVTSEAANPALAEADAPARDDERAGSGSTVRWRGWIVTISGPVEPDRLQELFDALP